jgi:hypothetical protein
MPKNKLEIMMAVAGCRLTIKDNKVRWRYNVLSVYRF